MENIFIKKDSVISSFIVPWILGYGNKTPEQIEQKINFGETLDPDYYPINQEFIKSEGEESVYLQHMKVLFHETKIDYRLTQIIGENVYKPRDCYSGIYQIEINENMGLIAYAHGITKNNECVIMNDDYITKFWNTTEQEIKIKLLSTLAVWKAKKGVYIITKMNKNIYIDFDNSKWEEILFKIKLWSEQLS